MICVEANLVPGPRSQQQVLRAGPQQQVLRARLGHEVRGNRRRQELVAAFGRAYALDEADEALLNRPATDGAGLDELGQLLGALMKRKDAYWFAEPVPQDTEGYFEMISSPMDYGSIQTKLEAAGYPDADALPESGL